MLNLLIAFYLGGLLVRLADEVAVGDVTLLDIGKSILYPVNVVVILTPVAVELYNTVAKLWRKPNA